MTHELDSSFIYIHPPLAIAGFIITFLFAITIFAVKRKKNNKNLRLLGSAMWLFAFAGLVSGMVWAQLAWGSYWSWDPKETLSLLFFLSVSVSQVALIEKKHAASKWFSIISSILAVITLSSSFIISGLHSFA